jgi:triosephosphate isomerase
MRQLIAGNWKMNGTRDSLRELADLRVALAARPPAADVLICPPATLLSRALASVAHQFELGGQDCHAEVSGAFTGDVSAEMLRDAGATAVIVGHSERRRYHGETDAEVAAKARAAWRAGLLAIVCIGETEGQHDDGKAHEICESQLSGSVPDGATAANTAIAYEPVWAIGSGRTPTSPEITDVHRHIRGCLAARFGTQGSAMRVLYGGSMKPSNAAEILGLKDVGGGLIGGASLKAADFLAIIACAAAG